MVVEAVIELIRPLVNNDPWDYCVVWKLRKDPLRFIEWGECCCSGGRNNGGAGITIQGGHTEECRDRLVKHPVRSDACMMLAQLPYFNPLDSGIYGDVIMSNIPRWKTQDVGSSVPNAESKGTQVLIPLTWGLIELFSIKHVPRDQKLIDFISSQCGVHIMQTNQQENWDPFLNLQPINDSISHGFSEIEALLHSLDHDLTGMPPETSSKVHAGSQSRDKGLKRKTCADTELANVNEKASMKLEQKRKKRSGRDLAAKRLKVTRYTRRVRDRFMALRLAVPNITKMNRLSILKDAVDYIKEHEATIRNYRHELKDLKGKKCEETNSPVRHEREKNPRVLQVEVNQFGAKIVKMESNENPRAFTCLLQAIDSLGLRVTSANVTTLHGMVAHVLTVEAMESDLDETILKHSLVLLMT